MRESRSHRLVCIIAGRNLGDIVLASSFLARLANRNYADEYLAWTRPEAAFLFSGIPNCSAITSSFPVGTAKAFNLRELIRFFGAALKIRKRHPTVTIDLIGDFREHIFAKLLGSKQHLHINWEVGHPFNNLIRHPVRADDSAFVIPRELPNVYDAYSLFLDMVSPETTLNVPSLRNPKAERLSSGEVPRIGIHMFASQKCKLWPNESWRQLIQYLLDNGLPVTVFASPNEKVRAAESLGYLADRVILITLPLQAFLSSLNDIDVLVGVDSVAVHMAAMLGKSTLTINSGNPPNLWTPPSGKTISSSGNCNHYPCYNRAPCENASHPYICIRSITPAEVIRALDIQLRSAGFLGEHA